MSMGLVYLIGAGPGDPELITVAGLRALRSASAIVHDALVSGELLAEAAPHALVFPMGKRANRPSADQDDINAQLIALAQAGHTVARLKGGDPFVFGRGGEEVEALAAAGIPYRVIPGISSALAAAASFNIPVTHRQVSASFAVVTAHRIEGADAPNWHALSCIDTVVILMGANHVLQIAQRLMACGRAAQTPMALIESATLPDARIRIATLGTIGKSASAYPSRAPLVIVVGEVVGLRSRFELQTLAQVAVNSGS